MDHSLTKHRIQSEQGFGGLGRPDLELKGQPASTRSRGWERAERVWAGRFWQAKTYPRGAHAALPSVSTSSRRHLKPGLVRGTLSSRRGTRSATTCAGVDRKAGLCGSSTSASGTEVVAGPFRREPGGAVGDRKASRWRGGPLFAFRRDVLLRVRDRKLAVPRLPDVNGRESFRGGAQLQSAEWDQLGALQGKRVGRRRRRAPARFQVGARDRGYRRAL